MIVDACQVIPVPQGLDPLQAAMLSVNPATAWRMLHDFATLQPGDWIVQNAANSGVGRAVIQLARALGIRTLNLVRRPELIDELLALGADVVTGEDMDLRKSGLDLCAGHFPKLGLNAVGGASALNVANALAPDSTLVTYGAMSRQPLKIPNSLLIFKNLTFSGFWLRRWKESASPAEIRETYSRLADFLACGILHTPVQSVYPLARVGEAIQSASMEKRSGKVLLDLATKDETH
jgi:NADPH:quinone reductase-like Zn-dependent oxidoreductase